MAHSNNPYIDEALMHAYAAYSPTENSRYLRDHHASRSTQQANDASHETVDQSLTHNQSRSDPHAISQQTIAIGIPTGDGVSDAPPLSHCELRTLKEGTVLYILDSNDNDGEEAWMRFTFLGLESDGFRVKNSVEEEIFYATFDDEDMPVIYVENEKEKEKEKEKETIAAQEKRYNYILADFSYSVGAEIFVYDDANNFVFYRIESYDAKSTKASLSDKSGKKCSLFLNNFKHEAASAESKAIPIIRRATKAAVEEKKECVNFIDIDAISSKWNWIQRTNGMKLKWISYKNTLFGCIAAATKHLYPISLDYKAINFVSGNCATFHWLDIDDDNDDDNDVIEEHMKLFVGDSHLDTMLNNVTKYTHYKFERFEIREILNDDKNARKRLMDLEQIIIAKLNNNICSITHDEYGHFALIVGYFAKPIEKISGSTMFYFKIKKFGVYNEKDINANEEYVACDLEYQQIVITIDAPPKDKKYSFQHSFSPKILHQIVSDFIAFDEAAKLNKNGIDLFGFCAFQEMLNELEKGKKVANVSSIFGKQTIFALIRLFDSRKTLIEFLDFIGAKIQNAFHSQTGSESEWKFEEIHDISEEIDVIQQLLKEEIDSIRRQQMLFDKYILNYCGRALQKYIEWKPIHRAGCKAALQLIAQNEAKIMQNFKQMQIKLKKYLSS